MCDTAKTKNFVTESTEKGDFVFMKKKQWMSLLLAAAMAVSVLPAGAFAEEADEAAGGTQAAVVSQQEQAAPNTTEVQPAETVSDEVDPEANIGGESYDTLEAAVAAARKAQGAATITLNRDVVLESKLVLDAAGLTLDLNGKTVSAGPGFESSDGQPHLVDITAANVTVKNGTIKTGAENRHGVNVYRAANTVLEGLTIDHTAAVTGAPLVVNGSDVTVRGQLNILTSGQSWYGINLDSTDAAVSARLTIADNAAVKFGGAMPGTPLGIAVQTSQGAAVTLCFGANSALDCQPGMIPVGAAEGTTVQDPENAGLQANGDGTYTAKEEPGDGGETGAVALVNGEACADLQAAVEKITELAQAGTAVTVVLQQDVNVGKGLTISEGWNVTLDLNGKAVATEYNSGNEKSAYAVSNYGTFTLKDAAGGGKITARGVQNKKNGTMYMQGGEIVACDKNGGAAIWNEAELTMTGGTLRSSYVGTPNDTYGAGCLNNSGTALVTGGSFEGANRRTYAIISTGTLTIRPAEGTPVTVNGAHGALAVDSGTAEVYGGSYASSDYYGLYVSNDGMGADPEKAAVTVYDGTFTGKTYAVWIGSDYNDPVNSTLEIRGGRFNKPLNAQDNTREGAIRVMGGTFMDKENAGKFLAEGYELTDNKDGTWTAGAVRSVAMVNGVGYPTLVAAVAAVTGSETKAGTVTLLEDAQGGGIGLFNADGAVGVDLTIDLGGHTYTCVGPAVGSSGTESQAFHLEKGNKVTVKNGTVAISEENNGVQMMFQNYGGLTLQDLSLKGARNTQYIISCNYGDTVLTNVNIDGTHANLVALDVMHWLGTTYEDKAPTVTVNNTKANTINGKLDVYCYGAGAESCTAKPTLSITGGTFSNDPSAYVADGYVVSGNETEGYTVSKYVAPTPTPNHGQGGGSQATPAPTATPAPVPTATPAPTATARPRPTATPAPSETPVVTDGTVTASTKTDAVVENATAVAAIENEQLAEAVEAALSDAEAAGAAPVVQVEVSRTEGAEAVEVTLPADALTTLAAREDAELVVTSDVARVAFDSAALTAIMQQAEQEIVLSVSPVAPAQLNEAQAAAADGFPVVELTLRSGDTVISDFSAGTATVTLPYALADGQQAEGVVVWYVDDNGGTTPCDTSYNEAEGLVTFTTPHFSKYAIAYDETLVPAAPEEQPVISVPDPEADKGGLPVLPMAIGAIAVVLIVLAVVLRLLFKRRDDEQGY